MAIANLGSALFTATQQKVLGLLYGKPDHTFYANQVCRIAALGKGTVMRELERLHKAGVIVMTKQEKSIFSALTLWSQRMAKLENYCKINMPELARQCCVR